MFPLFQFVTQSYFISFLNNLCLLNVPNVIKCIVILYKIPINSFIGNRNHSSAAADYCYIIIIIIIITIHICFLCNYSIHFVLLFLFHALII